MAEPRGPQSTVAAAVSQAISPVAKAAQARVQRFSEGDICVISKRRCRGETRIRPRLAMRPSHTTSMTTPIPRAIEGAAVRSIGERAADPGRAAIGRAQIRLVMAAKPVFPKRSTSLFMDGIPPRQILRECDGAGAVVGAQKPAAGELVAELERQL